MAGKIEKQIHERIMVLPPVSFEHVCEKDCIKWANLRYDIILEIHSSEPKIQEFPEKNRRNQLKKESGDIVVTNWGELVRTRKIYLSYFHWLELGASWDLVE